MKNPIVLAVVAVLVIIMSSAYIVDQRETAIKLRFGEIVEENIGPGLHFKVPFWNRIERFSSQILSLDANPERFLTNEKKYVQVDFFVKWRISETGKFFRSTGGDIQRAHSFYDSAAEILKRARDTPINVDIRKKLKKLLMERS